MEINNIKGFTLVELLIAITILSVGLLAVASMQATSLRGDNFAYQRTEAATLAQDQLEILMAMSAKEFKEFKETMSVGNKTHGSYVIEWDIGSVSGVTNAHSITVDVKRNGKKVIKSFVTKRSELFL